MRLRFALLLALFWLTSAAARAEVVVLACAEECTAAQFQALELELRGYGAILSARPAPAGFTPTARSADARHTGELLSAAVTLWLEHEQPLRVCAYSQRSGTLHEAPLPAPSSALDPAIFAAVAGSVALEALRATPQPNVAPAAVALAPAPGPAAPAPVVPPPEEPQPQPSTKRSSWSKRFFIRVGAALGFAVVGKKTHADRAPPASAVRAAAAAAAASGDFADADIYLETQGYDCDVTTATQGDGSEGIMAGNCKLAVRNPGPVFSTAIDLATGFNLHPRVALAATARIDPTVGYGTLAHALLGVQVEAALLQARQTGFWISAAAGFGGGQIQVRPPSSVKDAPYAKSGLFDMRAGFLFGYRFWPRLGIVVTPVVHALFPDTLWAMETNLNLEVRI